MKSHYLPNFFVVYFDHLNAFDFWPYIGLFFDVMAVVLLFLSASYVGLYRTEIVS